MEALPFDKLVFYAIFYARFGAGERPEKVWQKSLSTFFALILYEPFFI